MPQTARTPVDWNKVKTTGQEWDLGNGVTEKWIASSAAPMTPRTRMQAQPVPWQGFGSVEERNRWFARNRPGSVPVSATGSPMYGGAGTGPGGGAPASPGNLAGAPAFGYAGAYGGIPQVPSPGATQAAAVAGNAAALPGLRTLAADVNVFNTEQAAAPYYANLPGYGGMLDKSSGNIASNLAGELPPDVIYLLQQQAAERGVAMGSPTSPNSDSALLRALGLTSLQRKDLGESQLSGAIARTPVGPQFNPASGFVTPEQWQAAQAAANLYASAPIPAEKAAAELAAAQAGLGAGRGSTAPSGGGIINFPSLPQLPSTAFRGPGAPAPSAPGRSTPGPYDYAPPPTTPGRSYDPLATTSSRLEESLFSPYSLGGYDYGSPPAELGGGVSPQILEWAAPLMNEGQYYNEFFGTDFPDY